MDWSAYFKSHGDFVLAKLKDDESLYAAGLNVLCFIDGRVVPVDSIMHECSQHNWNRQIYEAWSLETRSRVFAVSKKLTGVSKEALLYVLEQDMSESEVNLDNALDAITKLKAIVENNMQE